MRKLIFTTILSMVALFAINAQSRPVQVETSGRKLSEARTLMDNTDIVRINKDWSLIAEFKSGTGEKVEFFPVEVVDPKTGIKMIALQMDLKIRTGGGGGLAMLSALSGGMGGLQSMGPAMAAAMANNGVASAWVDYDEIDRLIEFIEKIVVPNLDKKYKKKSSEFIFHSQEITMRYLIDESTKRISIILNNGEGNTPMYFFTESRAEKIGELLPILKRVKSKELSFE
jgi:hypothetical protein